MKWKVVNLRAVAIILAVSMALCGNGFVSLANARPTQPTPFSQDEVLVLEQAEADSREVLPVVIAGDSSDDAMVTAFAALGILALIGVLIAASQDDDEDSSR